ncbi:MAG: ketopantoate reductase family protein [Chloroflexota bacterium]|nr:ketopantoate reductase family protein [Chloroflexota bacterium]
MERRLLVIGAGAIGTLLTAQMAHSGFPVTLVGRPETAPIVRERGLRISGTGGEVVAQQIDVVASIADAFSGDASYQLAILSVKSYDTAQAAQELMAAARVPPPILSMQNGVGNEETLARVLGQDRVLAGVITTPVTQRAPGHVVLARSTKRIGLAGLVKRPSGNPVSLPALAELFASAGFQVQVFPDWRGLKWTKLLMNMLCNASCALTGWSPQRVWSDAGLVDLEIAAWREAMTIMDRLGIAIVSLGGYPLDRFEWALRGLPATLLRPALAQFIVRGRGDKMPSLYLDLERGKDRSEVHWLNGAVVTAGKAENLRTPANSVLVEALGSVVSGHEPWSTYFDRPEVLLEKWRLNN